MQSVSICSVGGDYFLLRNNYAMTSSVIYRRNLLRIGSWNIQTINGKSRSWNTLANVLLKFKIDIAAVQETKSNSFAQFNVEDYRVFQSPSNMDKGGLAFLVHKRYQNSITAWNAVSHRISTLSLYSPPSTVSFINVYAPNQRHSAEEKDIFYTDLDHTCQSLRRSKVFLLGDFNSHIGKDWNKWPKTMGKFGISGLSTNGTRLLSFCRERNLCIMNTYFQHDLKNKITWQSNNRFSMIDFFIAPAESRFSVFDVRTVRCEDFKSDHNLLVTKLKINCPTFEQ